VNLSSELAVLYRRDLTRLAQEIRAFPDDDSLWKTLPGITNPAGNLALHLEGNLREYIGRQVGSVAYERKRPLEFSNRGVSQTDLVARVEALIELIPPIIEAQSPEVLEGLHPGIVHDRPLSMSQSLISLLAHFNYHLGQIDYLRRA